MEAELTDRQREALLKALRVALLQPKEVPLFRRNRSKGLFPSSNGVAGEAAKHATEVGYLETVRTEVRLKRQTTWVKITAKGTEYLYQQESPRAILADLREFLHVTGNGLPGWMDRMLGELTQVGERFGLELARISQTLESLTQRVEEAIRRADASGITSEGSLGVLVPWAFDALQYLDHRRAIGAQPGCPLPELYEALRPKHLEMTITQFHSGLRRLVGNHALKYLAAPKDFSMPRPEFALLEAGTIYYHVDR